MKYLLDTNVCVSFLNERNPRLMARLRRALESDLVLCDVVKAELYYGAQKSERAADNLRRLDGFFSRFRSLPFDEPAARSYGRIRAALDAAGTPIGPNDLLIAAIALAHELALVTSNVGEFSRVEGLSVEDWAAEG